MFLRGEDECVVQVRNWSSRLSVVASTELEAAYYNAHVALWEPVLEPVFRPGGGRNQLQRWTLEFRWKTDLLR